MNSDTFQKVVKVVWRDTLSYSGWQDADLTGLLEDAEGTLMSTWGKHIKNSENYMVLAGTESSGGGWTDVSAIPLSCIKCVEVVNGSG